MVKAIKYIGLSLSAIVFMLIPIKSCLYSKEAKKLNYNYEYIIHNDSLSVGDNLTVTSMDTIPPNEEYSAVIEVHLK